MPRPHPRFSALAALPVLTLLATACSGPAPTLEPTAAAPIPTEQTTPGTTLGFGETAWLEVMGGTGEPEMVGASVRQITELDPDEIEGFTDDPEVAATTPYAIVVQYDWEPASEYDTELRDVPLLPITEDGEIAQWLANNMGNIAMGDFDGCGMTFPEHETGDGSVIDCFVGLSTAGPIIGAVYNGTTRSDFALDEAHPYAQAPVTWRE